jgi:ribosome maturation factor RimP
MKIAHEKLAGLDRDRIVNALTPVLDAHQVDCVELVWRSDRGERVLEVTVERPESTEPGAGVTLELCSDISRDLSTALDVADCIPSRYRLEVGSPGLERSLYGEHDFRRFAGHGARLKLKEPVGGQYVLVGTLGGIDDSGKVTLLVRDKPVEIAFSSIETARLVFEWRRGEPRGGRAPGRNTKWSRTERPHVRNGAGE